MNNRTFLFATLMFVLISASAAAGRAPKSQPAQDKTAIDLLGPNGKPIKDAQIASTSGEDLSSMGRKQALLNRYYTKKVCGKNMDKKESPLIVAIRMQDMPELVKLSKQKKFNSNGKDVCGMTAVQNAILQGAAPMVQFLLDHHASLKKKNLAHDNACATLKEIDDQNLARFLDLCKSKDAIAKNVKN